MSNDNKTLADVQPGGRVRLGDSRSTRAATFLRQYLTYLRSSPRQGLRPRWCDVYEALEIAIEALSAQPSPGGQDVLFIEELAELRRLVPSVNQKHALDAAIAALAVRQPVTMDDALAAGDGTLHGAIDHWQERALRAEAELAARQPVGEPFGYCADFDPGAHEFSHTFYYLAPGEKVPAGCTPFYAAPPAQAVDLGAMPDGWRLSKKTTCYQLSHGNEIIGNLVGPDAEENAAIIARVLDSQAVGK